MPLAARALIGNFNSGPQRPEKRTAFSANHQGFRRQHPWWWEWHSPENQGQLRTAPDTRYVLRHRLLPRWV